MSYKKHNGNIKFFNKEKQYGFIRSVEGHEIYFNSQGLKENVKHSMLTRGRSVLYHTRMIKDRFRAVKIELAD